jgi:hypothetical protein
MPKGYPGSGKARQPAEGGAVGGGDAVRTPIRDMLASGSEAEFLESLPSQTSSDSMESPEETKPRKKRGPNKKKEQQSDTPVDIRLERAKAKASGLGGAALIESGFKLSGEPLDTQEKEDLDDQFYLIACKAGIDPSGSWLFLILYTVALLARLVLSRTELGEQIRNLFAPKEEENKQGEASQPEGAAA